MGGDGVVDGGEENGEATDAEGDGVVDGGEENDKMVDHLDRKWKVSILRFNEDMTTSSFAGYLESNMYYGYHPPSDQDALLWSTGKRVDCLVIRSAKVSRASDSAYGKLIDLRNQESKREEKQKQENV